MRRLVLGVTVLLSLALLSACGQKSYRYRVTVEVETPQGPRTASSVWETTQRKGGGIPDRSIRSNYRGEAVALDLPEGTLLVPLRGADLDADYVPWLVLRHFWRHPDSSAPLPEDWATALAAIKRTRPAFELYPDEYPLMVRFRNPKVPTSVERVDPANLEATFGRGIRLKRIVVAVGDGPIPSGIVQKLPWLPDYLDKHLNGRSGTDSSDLTANLGAGDFSTELR